LDNAAARGSVEPDPILALRGLGKEIWRELGGGEKFIRELRESWHGVEAPARDLAKATSAKATFAKATSAKATFAKDRRTL
jgi:hypothetical protein